MLKKCFSLASAVSLGGILVWSAATTGCSSDDPVVAPDASNGTGDGGTVTGEGGSSSGSPDSGKIDPSTVPGVSITFGKCAAFTKCAGALEGTYKITGGCLPDTTFDSYKASCAGLTTTDVVIKADGTVTATPTTINRKTSIFVGASFVLPKDNCGALAIIGNDCSKLPPLLQSGVAGPKLDSATCVDAGPTCNCTIATTTTEPGADDPYTTDATGTLTYQETTENNPTFGLFIEITKQ